MPAKGQEDLPACLAWAHRFGFADTPYDRVQPPGQHSQLGFVPTAVRLTHKIIAPPCRCEQASIQRIGPQCFHCILWGARLLKYTFEASVMFWLYTDDGG